MTIPIPSNPVMQMFRRGNFRLVLWLCIALLTFPFCAQANDQPSVIHTDMSGAVPAQNAQIVKYHVRALAADSEDRTGELKIFYSDGTEVADTLRAGRRIADEYNQVAYKQRGIIDVKLAPDKRTIGWAETIDNPATSYAVPYALAIYQSGKTILHIEQGQMLWFWSFRDGGKQVAAVWGPTHGREVGDYQLYDTGTGRLLAEVFGDPATQRLRADAPQWAKELEREK